MSELTGSEILVRCLMEEGVEHIFGHPGGAILHTYDLMSEYPIKHFLFRHEQSAAHAAEGYYKASGKVGTVMVTSGPGACNTVTGLFDALLDSMGMVVLSGQVPTTMIGADAFQEADVVGTTRSCTKHNYLARETSELPRTLKSAYHIAGSGRPGPVLIDLPKDVMLGRAEFEGYPSEVDVRGYSPQLEGSSRQIRKAAELLARAKRPLIFGGGGIIHSGAARELRLLAGHGTAEDCEALAQTAPRWHINPSMAACARRVALSLARLPFHAWDRPGRREGARGGASRPRDPPRVAPRSPSALTARSRTTPRCTWRSRPTDPARQPPAAHWAEVAG